MAKRLVPAALSVTMLVFVLGLWTYIGYARGVFNTGPSTMQEWPYGTALVCAIGNLSIGTAYFGIGACLLSLYRRHVKTFRYMKTAAAFGVFISLCGAGHIVNAIGFYRPMYYLLCAMHMLTAMLAVFAWRQLVAIMPRLMEMKTPEQAAQEIIHDRDLRRRTFLLEFAAEAVQMVEGKQMAEQQKAELLAVLHEMEDAVEREGGTR